MNLYAQLTNTLSVRALVGATESTQINGDALSSHCLHVQENSEGVMSCPAGQVIVDIQHALNHRDASCKSPYVPGYRIDGNDPSGKGCLPHYIKSFIYWRAVGHQSYRFKAQAACFDETDKCFMHVKQYIVIYTCGTLAMTVAERNFQWITGSNDNLLSSPFASEEPNNWNGGALETPAAPKVAKDMNCNTYRAEPVRYSYLKGEDCLELTYDRSRNIHYYNDAPCHENYPRRLEDDGTWADISEIRLVVFLDGVELTMPSLPHVDGFPKLYACAFTEKPVVTTTAAPICSDDYCLNGGTCLLTSSGPACQCSAAFGGDRCQSASCASVCGEGTESCSEGPTCHCKPGWNGLLCEINIDDCSPSPCKFGGTCIDRVNGFFCQCAPGFTGTTCGVNIDDCESMPCANGGTCVDGVDSFSCTCAPGYTGTTCGVNIDDCESMPCANGGRCIDGVDSFSCVCAPGFTGTTCAVNIDDCESMPCANGGRCIDGVDSFSCACAPGFTGTTCVDDIDDCESMPCANGGRCIDGVESFSCVCAPGYTGAKCTEDVDECQDPGRCSGNGECENLPGDYHCICDSSHTGDDCSMAKPTSCETDANYCGDHGTCEEVAGGGLTCACDLGYTGSRCETNICQANCANGNCSADGICKCRPEWTGEFCTSPMCEQGSCSTGACRILDGVLDCDCTGTGMQGTRCDEDVDECEGAHDCLPEAACVNVVGTYLCQCPPGYGGDGKSLCKQAAATAAVVSIAGSNPSEVTADVFAAALVAALRRYGVSDAARDHIEVRSVTLGSAIVDFIVAPGGSSASPQNWACAVDQVSQTGALLEELHAGNGSFAGTGVTVTGFDACDGCDISDCPASLLTTTATTTSKLPGVIGQQTTSKVCCRCVKHMRLPIFLSLSFFLSAVCGVTDGRRPPLSSFPSLRLCSRIVTHPFPSSALDTAGGLDKVRNVRSDGGADFPGADISAGLNLRTFSDDGDPRVG